MKQTRLEKAIGTIAFKQLLPLYKEIKQTRDIHKILAFKSFITRIIEAQTERTQENRPSWVTMEEYLPTVILNKKSWFMGINSPLEFILDTVDNGGAFGYIKKEHFRRIL